MSVHDKHPTIITNLAIFLNQHHRETSILAAKRARDPNYRYPYQNDFPFIVIVYKSLAFTTNACYLLWNTAALNFLVYNICRVPCNTKSKTVAQNTTKRSPCQSTKSPPDEIQEIFKLTLADPRKATPAANDRPRSDHNKPLRAVPPPDEQFNMSEVVVAGNEITFPLCVLQFACESHATRGSLRSPTSVQRSVLLVARGATRAIHPLPWRLLVKRSHGT